MRIILLISYSPTYFCAIMILVTNRIFLKLRYLQKNRFHSMEFHRSSFFSSVSVSYQVDYHLLWILKKAVQRIFSLFWDKFVSTFWSQWCIKEYILPRIFSSRKIVRWQMLLLVFLLQLLPIIDVSLLIVIWMFIRNSIYSNLHDNESCMIRTRTIEIRYPDSWWLVSLSQGEIKLLENER
jgi:hypothetical protein